MPKYFKAWILFFLIATVGGMILGGIAGLFIGAGLAIAHVELGMIKIVCGLAGGVISVPLSYFTFRWVVSEFVVKELANTSPPVPAAVEPPPIAK